MSDHSWAQRSSALWICLAWLPALRGVDQIETWQPDLLASPHRMTPQRCPDDVGVTVHPASSAAARATSTSFLGCRALGMLTAYNIALVRVNATTFELDEAFPAC